MAGGLIISIKIDRAKRFVLDTIGGLLDQPFAEKVGLEGKRIIIDRTDQGRFLKGSSGKAGRYSPAYKKLRQKMGLPTGHVDLQFSRGAGGEQGPMMKSIDYLISKDFSGILVFIRGRRNRRIARYHNRLGAGMSKIIRRFFGWNAQEKKSIQKVGTAEFLQRFNQRVADFHATGE